MSRLQTIENKLFEINETVFQELCDSFLILRNRNYAAFSRTGSQTGKQKTRKGTPDSFFLLPDGTYLFVEFSTNISSGINKLSDDIIKCMSSAKTGIDVEDIKEIILCANFNLKPEEVKLLRDLVKGTHIQLTLFTLDSLAIELNLNHRDLVHQYLDLSFDTGQIVSLDTFIKEYNKASNGIATPLDNTFLHRDEEKQSLMEALHRSNFVILNGAAGVGKTKLAIETIKEFITKNDSYSAFCVSYKSYDLLEDMYEYFKLENDYILFVDDANRIDVFNQILGFNNYFKKGNFKILITVRDYALDDIKKMSTTLTKTELLIEKVTDEQLVDIIKSDPFNILNQSYHNEIIRIADGNPRLAIMTSLLAIEKQDLSALNDISELFDKYFATFVNDKLNVLDRHTVKCLGIISFFNTVPYKEKELIESILAEFEMDYYAFIDEIERLEKLELIEIKYDFVKIPEQNILNYFFYLAFIDKGYLSFDTLLTKYFNEKADRFKDCVLAANKSFGYAKVIKTIRPSLVTYLNSIKSEEKAFKFISSFWFYLQDEVLTYLYEKMLLLPNIKIEKYNTLYERNQFAYKKNEIIELFGNYFRSITRELGTTIELSLEFIRKQPELLPELIHKIRETLSFEYLDERYGFYRQITLFEVLTKGVNEGDDLYIALFYELAKTFLDNEFESVKAGRGNQIVFNKYKLPNSERVREFRKNIWKLVDERFINNEIESLELLTSYCKNFKSYGNLISFDKEFIFLIINENFNPEIFEHCLFVQEYLWFLKRNQIMDSELGKLKKKYSNELYEMFLKINWNRILDKEDYEFDDIYEFESLKEEEIRKSFKINSDEEVKDFLEKYLYLTNYIKNKWNQNKVLDIVVDENFNYDAKIGISLLEYIISINKDLSYVPHLVYKNQLRKNDITDKLHNVLNQNSFDNRLKWVVSFYENLDKLFLKVDYVDKFVEFIRNIDETVDISLERLTNLIGIKEDFVKLLLETITTENKTRKNKIYLDIRFNSLVPYLNKADNLQIIKEMYAQQYLLDSHFDFKGELLKYILNKDPEYLIEFVDYLYFKENKKFKRGYRLEFIWDINNIEIYLNRIFEFTIEKEFYISEHFCNEFFRDLNEDRLLKAKEFILQYIEANNTSVDKMNFIMDIIHNTRNEWLEEVIKNFVIHNQDIRIFSETRWVRTSRSYSGDQLWSDLEAADWRYILNIINSIDLGIKLIPIKKFITTRLEYLVQSAEEERKRKFLRDDL